MSRKQFKIRTKSYMPLTPDGNAKLCLSDLDDHQKDYLGALLYTNFLNSLCAGKIQFWAEEMPSIENVFPDYFTAREGNLT